jgi:phosphoribosyl-dephospho-CoA transferase
MHNKFDLNIRPLVATIKAFDGLTVIGALVTRPAARSVARRCLVCDVHCTAARARLARVEFLAT